MRPVWSHRTKWPLEVHHLLLLTKYRGACGTETRLEISHFPPPLLSPSFTSMNVFLQTNIIPLPCKNQNTPPNPPQNKQQNDCNILKNGLLQWPG